MPQIYLTNYTVKKGKAEPIFIKDIIVTMPGENEVHELEILKNDTWYLKRALSKIDVKKVDGYIVEKIELIKNMGETSY